MKKQTWALVKDAKRKSGEARYSAVRELHERGLSFSEIGKRIGVSKQRAHQMVNVARET